MVDGNGTPPAVVGEIHIFLLADSSVLPKWRLPGIPAGYMMLEVMREALLRESLRQNPVPSKSGIEVVPPGSIPPPRIIP
jgi:hypothetical protein